MRAKLSSKKPLIALPILLLALNIGASSTKSLNNSTIYTGVCTPISFGTNAGLMYAPGTTTFRVSMKNSSSTPCTTTDPNNPGASPYIHVSTGATYSVANSMVNAGQTLDVNLSVTVNSTNVTNVSVTATDPDGLPIPKPNYGNASISISITPIDTDSATFQFYNPHPPISDFWRQRFSYWN